MRVVIDTNVFVSALILPRGSCGPILLHLRNGVYTLLYSHATLTELVDVLNRPRLRRKYGLTVEDVQTVVALILLRGEAVNPVQPITLCRDPKDNQFLEAAVAGQADILVSGDQDLLVLQTVEQIPIVTPRIFLEQLAGLK